MINSHYSRLYFKTLLTINVLKICHGNIFPNILVYDIRHVLKIHLNQEQQYTRKKQKSFLNRKKILLKFYIYCMKNWLTKKTKE